MPEPYRKKAEENQTRKRDQKKKLNPSKIRVLEAKREVQNLLCQANYNPADIKEILQDKYGYSPSSCDDVIRKAREELTSRYEDWVNDIADRNLKRLQCLYEELYLKGEYKLALRCIDMLNRMCGAYTDDTSKAGAAVFKIRLGDDNTTT